jgi:hypothetical protein
MKTTKIISCVVAVLIVAMAVFGAEGKFATFPDDQAGLRSPDGKFIVRSVEEAGDPSNFVGVHRSLILEDHIGGGSWKLCDYLGHVAVTWATDNLIIVNEYYTSNGARMRLFAADGKIAPLMIDRARLARIVSDDLGRHLTGNDHVYVEGYKLNGNILGIRVWGFGAVDKNGFRFKCDYNLEQNTASCSR